MTEEVVLVWSTAWDTVSDAQEFYDAYVKYADARFGFAANGAADDGWTCWEGRDALCASRGGGRVTLVIGPEQEVVDQVLVTLASE